MTINIEFRSALYFRGQVYSQTFIVSYLCRIYTQLNVLFKNEFPPFRRVTLLLLYSNYQEEILKHAILYFRAHHMCKVRSLV